MDPEATLKDILDMLDTVSNPDLNERDLSDELWNLKYGVFFYSGWIDRVKRLDEVKDEFIPNFQNVVKEWLTNKEARAYNAPAKNQKQFWDDSTLGRFDL